MMELSFFEELRKKVTSESDHSKRDDLESDRVADEFPHEQSGTHSSAPGLQISPLCSIYFCSYH